MIQIDDIDVTLKFTGDIATYMADVVLYKIFKVDGGAWRYHKGYWLEPGTFIAEFWYLSEEYRFQRNINSLVDYLEETAMEYLQDMALADDYYLQNV